MGQLAQIRGLRRPHRGQLLPAGNYGCVHIGEESVALDAFGGLSYLRSLPTVDGLKQKYGMSTVPFTSRSVTEIFKMAVDRHPPFKESKEDVGFRGAAILLSVVDHLVAAKNET